MGALADELQQIRDRLDYVMAMGYDFFSTEMGVSGFTAPDPGRRPAWRNEATGYPATHHHPSRHLTTPLPRGRTARLPRGRAAP